MTRTNLLRSTLPVAALALIVGGAAGGERSAGLFAQVVGPDADHARANGAAVVPELGEALEARARNLFSKIMCWCPSENWTRTLGGCAEPCAEPQKTMVRAWLAEGLGDQQIIDRMVEEARRRVGPEGVKVQASSKSLTLVLPFVILAAAVLLVASVLRRLVRRGSDEGPVEPLSAAEEPGGEWDRRLEDEIRAMEDQ